MQKKRAVKVESVKTEKPKEIVSLSGSSNEEIAKKLRAKLRWKHAIKTIITLVRFNMLFVKERIIELQKTRNNANSEEIEAHNGIKRGEKNHIKWLIMVILITVWNAVSAPLRIAFPDLRLFGIIGIIVDYASDAVLLGDIYVQSALSINHKGEIVTDRVVLRKMYMKSARFFLDVVTIVPWDAVLYISESTVDYVPLVRMLRLYRLVRVMELTGILEKSITVSFIFVRFAVMAFWTLLLMHLCACIWHYIGYATRDDPMSWVRRNNLLEESWQYNYIRSLYWSSATLATVGYGDIYPVTVRETIFAIFTLVLSQVLSAYIIGTVAAIVQNLGESQSVFRGRMSKMHRWLKAKRIPKDTQERVMSYLEYTWASSQGIDENTLFTNVPVSLQAEVAVFLHLETVKKVPLFQFCSQQFLVALVLRLKHQIALVGETIIKLGDYGEHMYIVSRGNVAVYIAGDIEVKRLGSGSVFGEVALLNRSKRTATIRALEICDLYVLSATDLNELFQEFPQEQFRVKYVEAFLQKERERAARIKAFEVERKRPTTEDSEKKPLLTGNTSNDNSGRSSETNESELRKLLDRQADLPRVSQPTSPAGSSESEKEKQKLLADQPPALKSKSSAAQPLSRSTQPSKEENTLFIPPPPGMVGSAPSADAAKSVKVLISSESLSGMKTLSKPNVLKRSPSSLIEMESLPPSSIQQPDAIRSPAKLGLPQPQAHPEERKSATAATVVPIALPGAVATYATPAEKLKEDFFQRPATQSSMGTAEKKYRILPGSPVESRGESRFRSSTVTGMMSSTANTSGSATPTSGLAGLSRSQPRFILFPDSKAVQIWDFVVIFVTIWNGVEIPYQICIGLPAYPILVVGYVVDVIFMIDIFLRFFRAQYDRGIINADLATIRKRYLRRQFFIDLLCSFPGDAIVQFLGLYSTSNSWRIIGACLRIPRLVHLSKIHKKIENIERINHLSTVALRVTELVFWVVFLAHWTGCFWYLIASTDNSSKTWIKIDKLSDDSTGLRKWLRSVYWASATLTTVGYGDIVPVSTRETIFILFVLVGGQMIYALIIGSMSALVAESSQLKAQFAERLEKITAFGRWKQLPGSMIDKMYKYHDFLWETNKGLEQTEVMQMLSDATRSDVQIELFTRIMGHVSFFDSINQTSCQTALASRLKNILAIPDDVIKENGEFLKECYFIERGTVEVQTSTGETLAVINGPAHFGEYSLLISERLTTRIIATTYCEFYVLSQAEFDEALKDFQEYYPDMLRAARAYAESGAKFYGTEGKIEDL